MGSGCILRLSLKGELSFTPVYFCCKALMFAILNSVKYSILGPAGDTARFCDSLARAAENVWEILQAA
jgi:hypothetical protein